MSERVDFTLTATDGTRICCYEWPCAGARAAVVVVHGLADHAARYGRFAEAMNGAGIAVLAMDLRGHGATADSGVLGRFAEKDGWKLVLEDVRRLTVYTREHYPAAPLVLLGHSVGSIIARASLFAYGGLYHAAVLTGVSVDLPVRRNLAPAIARAVSFFQGRSKPSKFLDTLTFGSFNKKFRPNRTPFDWLNRDTAEVDLYVADKRCGFVATGSMFIDLAVILVETLKRRNIGKMPKRLPILLLSGSRDPVGLNGKAAAYLKKRYQDAGLGVTVKIYPEARHELLNETNRGEVTADILEFINRSL